MAAAARTARSPSYWLKLARSSPFVHHNAVFFTGSMVVAALNYAYYPVLSRLMTTADFGEVQALASILLQVSILFNILSYVTVHIAVNAHTESERNRLLFGIEKYASLIGIGLFVLSLAGIRFLQKFLNFTQAWPFVALLAALAFTLPLAFRMAFLRGRKQFLKSTASDGIGSLVKLILSAIFVIIGWRTFGAMVGLALSQVVSLAFAYAWAHRAGLKGHGLLHTAVPFHRLKPQLTYALGVFVLSVCITAIMSVDVIAAKHYFSPETAGQYAGVSTIARIIFFVTAPITGVLITLVSINQPAHLNRRRLQGSLTLGAALGALTLLVMALAPRLVIQVLVGSKYLAFSRLLPRLALGLLILTLANMYLMYQVSLNKLSYSLVPIVGILTTITAIYWYHTTVIAVVNDIVIGSMSIALATLVWRIREQM